MTRSLPMMLILAGLMSAASALAEHAVEAPSTHGLSELDSGDFDTVRVATDADLGHYASVYVARPEVAFRKHWVRDQNRNVGIKVRDRDVQRIKDDLSGLMQRVVTEAFEAAGYTLADSPGAGVLIVQPDIVDLDLVAPDLPTASRTMSYSESAGAMTLDLTLRDGETGRTLMQIEDRQRDPRRGWYEWRTRPYNQAVARRMMRSWAESLPPTVARQSATGDA